MSELHHHLLPLAGAIPAGLWPSSPSPLFFLVLPGSLSRSPSLSVFHQLQVAAALVNPRRSSVDAPLAGSGPETGGSIHPRLSPVPFAASHTPLLVPEHGRLTGRIPQQSRIKPRAVVLVLVASPLSSSAQGDEPLSNSSNGAAPRSDCRRRHGLHRLDAMAVRSFSTIAVVAWISATGRHIHDALV